MTDHDVHRLIGQLSGTLAVLSKLVESIDQRNHDTHGEVSGMKSQISELTRRLDALTGPVTSSAIAEARNEGGDAAVAQAAAARNDIVRTVIAVTTLVAGLVSTGVGALVWFLSRNGGSAQ